MLDQIGDQQDLKAGMRHHQRHASRCQTPKPPFPEHVVHRGKCRGPFRRERGALGLGQIESPAQRLHRERSGCGEREHDQQCCLPAGQRDDRGQQKARKHPANGRTALLQRETEGPPMRRRHPYQYLAARRCVRTVTGADKQCCQRHRRQCRCAGEKKCQP